MSTLTLFNKTIEDTLEYIIKIAERKNNKEEIRQLKLAKEKLQIAIKYDPRKILENFLAHVYQFKKDIMAKNEDFFLKEDIKKHLTKDIYDQAKENGIDEQYILAKSMDIKNQWKILTENDKNYIWKMFQQMITLMERYVIQNMNK